MFSAIQIRTPFISVVLGVSSNNASSKDLGPYPAGATLSLVNFANFNQDCIDVALTLYMQYLPFVLLIQAVSIIFIEKLLMKFPRVSGKIERFYGTIVEESLFGKDPDVAEDVQDTKCNVEVIARRRRRNEVCMSLKRSKTQYIHHEEYCRDSGSLGLHSTKFVLHMEFS